MNNMQRALVALALLLAATMGGCARDSGTDEHRDSDTATEGQEESGTELALDEALDRVRNGVRLILAYDAQTNAFNGTVENTTKGALKQVRVEVHLSNGIELGPTAPVDLEPGEIIDVRLAATDSHFDGWTAHPEVGQSGRGKHGGAEGEGEHGNGEGAGEQDGQGGGEHNGGGSD